MTRQEHMKWCKDRALAYLQDNPPDAVASMTSDLSKHPDTADTLPSLLMAGMIAAQSNDTGEVERWITGFN